MRVKINLYIYVYIRKVYMLLYKSKRVNQYGVRRSDTGVTCRHQKVLTFKG